MQPLRLLDANRNIQNLKILLRVDFNVPLQNQQVSDATKIIKVKLSKYLKKKNIVKIKKK